MDCLNSNQLALYLATLGLGEKERNAYEKHLAECKKCRDKLNRMKKLVHEQQFENQEACAEIRGELEAYALGEASKVQTEAVLNHSGECHNCNALLSFLAKAFTFEDVGLSDIPVSENLVARIGRALDQKLDGSLTHPDVKKNKMKEIAEDIKDFIDQIRLSITPFEPVLGFRGDEESQKSEFVEVAHTGGDLVINVGFSSVIVELYSSRDKYLDDDESNSDGRVIFNDIDSGSYKIKVLGHRIDALE